MLSGSDINQTSSSIHARVSMKDSISSDGHDIAIVNASRSQEFGYEAENCFNNDASDYLHTRVSITSNIGSDDHYTIIQGFQQYDHKMCLSFEHDSENCMEMLGALDDYSQRSKLGFTSRSTARVILGQVLRIATCGTRTHRGDSL